MIACLSVFSVSSPWRRIQEPATNFQSIWETVIGSVFVMSTLPPRAKLLTVVFLAYIRVSPIQRPPVSLWMRPAEYSQYQQGVALKMLSAGLVFMVCQVVE